MNINRIIVVLLPFVAYPLLADLFYFPSEYNALYNEKYALEIEYNDLKTQYENELKRLNSEKLSLESQLKNANEDLDLEKQNRDKDKELYGERLREESMRNRALEEKGSSREKALLEDVRQRETKDKQEIDQLRKRLETEEKSYIAKIRELKESYEAKLSQCQERIQNLESEIAKLKNLTEAQKKDLNRLSDQAKELEDKLKSEISLGQIRLKRFHNKLIINIDDKISFDSGSADLKPEILPAIEKIRDILASYPENYIIVEGHTDNIPIKTRFRNNWQLSSERALSVLEFLLSDKRLISRNFSLAGNGEFQPLVSNATKENRALNRRVDIVVIPRGNSDQGKKHE